MDCRVKPGNDDCVLGFGNDVIHRNAPAVRE